MLTVNWFPPGAGAVSAFTFTAAPPEKTRKIDISMEENTFLNIYIISLYNKIL
jgi:hypothetical protein